MKRRTRMNYSDAQKSQMWDRWQRGESLKSIGRQFNRGSGSSAAYCPSQVAFVRRPERAQG
jgi:hypothetical protein